MRRLCADLHEDSAFASALDFTNSKHDYLAPHGSTRRGEGVSQTARIRPCSRAVGQLPAVVREHYSHIKAPERSADVGAAFDDEDREK